MRQRAKLSPRAETQESAKEEKLSARQAVPNQVGREPGSRTSVSRGVTGT